jgi:ribosomal protein S18 acetylase RimI-like enzyme
VRNTGVGTRLLDEAKNHAMEMGAKRIILSTNRDRESYKRGFYKKYRFNEKNSAWLKIDL